MFGDAERRQLLQESDSRCRRGGSAARPARQRADVSGRNRNQGGAAARLIDAAGGKERHRPCKECGCASTLCLVGSKVIGARPTSCIWRARFRKTWPLDMGSCWNSNQRCSASTNEPAAGAAGAMRYSGLRSPMTPSCRNRASRSRLRTSRGSLAARPRDVPAPASRLQRPLRLATRRRRTARV